MGWNSNSHAAEMNRQGAARRALKRCFNRRNALEGVGVKAQMRLLAQVGRQDHMTLQQGQKKRETVRGFAG